MRKIRPHSVEKVTVLLQGIYPRAASMSYVREITRLPYSTILYICEGLKAGSVEIVETTNGRFYRWKGA